MFLLRHDRGGNASVFNDHQLQASPGCELGRWCLRDRGVETRPWSWRFLVLLSAWFAIVNFLGDL